MKFWKIGLIALGIVILGIALWHAIIVLVKVVSFVLIVALALIPAAIIYGIYRVVKRFKR